ncbi:MAG TPA: hypothetical protein VGK17_24670 [Propionicimonas sp.]
MWQLVSVGFGAGEFAYDLQPPLLAMIAGTLTVVGWLALGVWAGHNGVRAYLWFAMVFWLLILAMLVLVKIALLAEGDSVGPWHGALIIPILFAGGPLHPLAYVLPLRDPLSSTLVVAGAMLAASLASYFLALGHGRTRTSQARDISQDSKKALIPPVKRTVE